MKKYFMVSLVKNGLLGGSIVADSESITFHTGKVTVPQEYRHLVMKYEDISEVTKGLLFILPMVTVKMRNGNEYKFVVFFGRKRLVDAILIQQRILSAYADVIRGKTVTEAAIEAGFSSSAHFADVNRRVFGISIRNISKDLNFIKVK